MLCYIDKIQLTFKRNKLFGVAADTWWNEPVLRLQQRTAHLLKPTDTDRDAYLVGLFLGMAQSHFYPSPPATDKRGSWSSPEEGIPPSPRFQDLKLRILTHDRGTSEFILYTGSITKEFLEKLHDPFKAPPGEDDAEILGPKIEYARVPIWPVLGLRERLGKALGHDVAGSFNPNEMVTWETDPEGPDSGKRKREVLSEVDRIFEGIPDDEPSLVAKGRC